MKKLLFILFLIPAILTLWAVRAEAYVIDKKYDRTYELQDEVVKVKEVKTFSIVSPNWYIPAGSEELFIIFNPIENDPKQEEKLNKTLSSIKIIDSLGNSLNYNSETTESKNLLIKVRTPKNIRFNENYKMELSYDSYGLIIKSGAIRDMYVPAFAEDYQFETDNALERVSTRAIIPASYGEINFVVPETGIKKDGDFWLVDFPQEQLIGETGWIQIGKTQYYTFKINQQYKPSTTLPVTYNTYRVVIPRDIQTGVITQKVYYTKFSPEPYYIEEDSDGNLIAVYRVPGIDSGEITIEGYSVLENNLSLDFAKSGTIEQINRSLIDRNTQSSKFWESGSMEIQQAARDIRGTEKNVYELIKKTYEYVVDKIDYSDVKRFGINERQGALATLRGGAAVCMEYSDLFIALMRSMGIPARGAFGHGYSALEYVSTQDNTINHQWAEVYIPGLDTWVPVDTTWGENGRTLIGGDLNHFYSHVASKDPETPSTTEVIFYGNASDIPNRGTIIETVDRTGIENMQGESEENVLQKYPKINSQQEFLSNTADSFKLLFSTIDKNIGKFLSSIISNNAAVEIVKLIIYSIPLVLIGVYVYLSYRKRKKKKIETLTTKSQMFKT